MKIIVNLIGVEVRLKEEVSVEPATPALGDVVLALTGHFGTSLERFVGCNLAPVDGSAILVNGRNFLSLDGWATEVHAGDELTFVVPVAGG